MVTIVVPNHNEPQIDQTLAGLFTLGCPVVIANDPEGKGVGWAMREGLKEVHTEWVLFAMADGSEGLHSLRETIKACRHPYDAIWGDRWDRWGYVTGYPRWKRILNRLGNHLIARVSPRPTYQDWTDLAKAYKTERLRLIRWSDDFRCAVEIPLRYHRSVWPCSPATGRSDRRASLPTGSPMPSGASGRSERSSSVVSERSTCRACGGTFDPLLNLGTPVLSDFLHPEAPDPPRVPLDVVVCQSCDLVQLRHTVDPEKLYRTYWYRSGVNEAMRAELKDVAQTAYRLLNPNDWPPRVLDIGANDGTLLSFYPSGWDRTAVEPALNISPSAHADATLREFFPQATSYIGAGSMDIITAIACFYDLDDPKAFVAEVDRLLTPDGVWICQFQDLGQQVATNAFDNFVAEHLCYYTATAFARLLEGFDLAIVDGETRPINGGSLRFIIRRRSRNAWSWIDVQRVYEERTLSRDALDHFAWRVGQYKDQLLGAIDHALGQDLYLDLYAASTKSSTLLQYCGIDHSRIRQAAERSPEKWGLVTSGTRIPIVSEEAWRQDPAPITILGAWQWTDQFVQREADYLSQGGAFLVPLPAPRLIYGGQ